MKKSLKRFLIISQVLGWSALFASACTDEQVKSATQTINANLKTNNQEPTTFDSNKSDVQNQNNQTSYDSEQKNVDQNKSPKKSGVESNSAKDGTTLKANTEKDTHEQNADGSVNKMHKDNAENSGTPQTNNKQQEELKQQEEQRKQQEQATAEAEKQKAMQEQKDKEKVQEQHPSREATGPGSAEQVSKVPEEGHEKGPHQPSPQTSGTESHTTVTKQPGK